MENEEISETLNEEIETSVNVVRDEDLAASRDTPIVINESDMFPQLEKEETSEETEEKDETEAEDSEETEESEDKSEESEEAEEADEADESPMISWETKKGEKFEASEQELKSAYCLYEENKKRMTEISNEKKELEQDLMVAQQSTEFTNKIKTLEGQDLLLAVLDQANTHNPKVEQALEAFYSKVFKEAQTVASMTPQERAAYDQQKKLEYYESQEQTRVQQEKASQEANFIRTERERIKTDWSVDDSLVTEANKVAIQKGLINETTPLNKASETVEAIIKDYVFEGRAKEVLDVINPELKLDISVLDDLVEWQFRNPKAGAEALEKRAKKLFGSEKKDKQPKRASSSSSKAKKKKAKKVHNFYGNEGKDNIVY